MRQAPAIAALFHYHDKTHDTVVFCRRGCVRSLTDFKQRHSSIP